MNFKTSLKTALFLGLSLVLMTSCEKKHKNPDVQKFIDSVHEIEDLEELNNALQEMANADQTDSSAMDLDVIEAINALNISRVDAIDKIRPFQLNNPLIGLKENNVPDSSLKYWVIDEKALKTVLGMPISGRDCFCS